MKRFVIPLDLPNDMPQTETRALVSLVKDKPGDLLLRMEPPFYRVETEMMGFRLVWAPGAEHVYSGKFESVSDFRASIGEHPRITPGGGILLIAVRGPRLR
jgi:hypothetical protein